MCVTLDFDPDCLLVSVSDACLCLSRTSSFPWTLRNRTPMVIYQHDYSFRLHFALLRGPRHQVHKLVTPGFWNIIDINYNVFLFTYAI